MEKKPATWYPTPVSRKATVRLIEPAKRKIKKLPRYPLPLRQRLNDAINDAEREVQICFGNTDWKIKLDRWRELNKMNSGAIPEELLSSMRPLQKLLGCNDEELSRIAPWAMASREGMDTRLFNALERLDTVFTAVHNFELRQAMCDGLPGFINSQWKTGSVNDETKQAKDYLRSVNYFDAPDGSPKIHGTKGFHRAQVLKLVSTGTVQKITAELRVEMLESQNRTEK